MNLTVTKATRTWVDVPFRDIPARNMVRELPHWTLFEICRVTLGCGVEGFGETMCYYTWGTVSDEAAARVVGGNAHELMWDDSLGAGLQMALFDAVGKALELPVWALLGKKHRDRAALSFWDIDMNGEDWLSECRLAVESGYTSFKTKARPWFDLTDQLDTLCPNLPPWFDLDLDFNGFLVDAARGARVIESISGYRNVAILESPIPQRDVSGMKRLREVSRVPFAMHYGTPSLQTVVANDLCDGFVVGGGASAVLRTGAAIAECERILWLQLVGTGITATWAIHLAAVLSHARWPAVNCHQLYTDELINPRIAVADGTAPVPEAPGLGVTLDEDAVERYRIEPVAKPYPFPDLLVAIRWPSGGSSYYAHTMQYWRDFEEGRLSLFPKGVYLERVSDDGSREWRDLADRAKRGGVHTGRVPSPTSSDGLR